MKTVTENIIDFKYINGCYVCHFLSLITDKDKKLAEEIKGNDIFGIDTLYSIALNKAKIIGGRKFHNKKYGGGIAFESKDGLQERINKLLQS